MPAKIIFNNKFRAVHTIQKVNITGTTLLIGLNQSAYQRFTDATDIAIFAHSQTPKAGAFFWIFKDAAISGRFMIPLANRLAEEMQVYIPDYPECGWSDKPADPPNVSELTDIMCKWMDSLHTKQAMFVGNSLESQVAIDLAYRYPDRVARLVLTGVSPEPGFRLLLGQYGRQLLSMQLEPISMKMIYFMEFMQTGLLRMIRMIQRTSNNPIEEKLPYLTMPVLVMRGKRDMVVSQNWSEKVTELLPHARLQVITGKAHSIVYSAYDQVADMTLSFMREETTLEASTGSDQQTEMSGTASATL